VDVFTGSRCSPHPAENPPPPCKKMTGGKYPPQKTLAYRRGRVNTDQHFYLSNYLINYFADL